MSAATIHTFTIVLDDGESETLASLSLDRLNFKVNEHLRSSPKIEGFLKALARDAGTDLEIRRLIVDMLARKTDLSFEQLDEIREADVDDLAHTFGQLEGWRYSACEAD